MLITGDRTFATPEQIAKAREMYAAGSDDDIEIDDFNVPTSECDNGVWVQAWVWLPNEDEVEA